MFSAIYSHVDRKLFKILIVRLFFIPRRKCLRITLKITNDEK